MPAAVDEAIAALLGNPFDLPRVRLTSSIALLSRKGALEPWLRRPRGAEAAERATLAIAHAHALAAPAGGAGPRPLGHDVLPAAVARLLRQPRSTYVSVGAAAARCFRALDALHGTSAAMASVRRATWAACFGESLEHALLLGQVIHDHDVLILGETGTGKEAVAHAVQEGCIGPKDGGAAPRASLNVAAVPETLVAAELFGHVKGAFTGAADARVGRIRSAYGGSLFLDEIGDLAVTTQVKLLRVMETDEVSPLGSDKTYPSSCRYIAATHKDLDAMVEEGKFRRDLHQRLAGNVIRLPPLRDRPEDIVPIGERFVERHLPGGALPATRRRIDGWLGSDEAKSHPWPGNVRELQNALRNMLLGLDPGVERRAAPVTPSSESEALPDALRENTATMEQVVDWYIRRVVDHSSQNLARAARTLAVDRTTLRRRLRARG
ncbi:MAG: sigma-54-dependent Fis family transcriptional regulator [Labilithrix sp.]|nr:sigma-54-dependent Fis family transcriptional regulator [Labilithrix sp.]